MNSLVEASPSKGWPLKLTKGKLFWHTAGISCTDFSQRSKLSWTLQIMSPKCRQQKFTYSARLKRLLAQYLAKQHSSINACGDQKLAIFSEISHLFILPLLLFPCTPNTTQLQVEGRTYSWCLITTILIPGLFSF